MVDFDLTMRLDTVLSAGVMLLSGGLFVGALRTDLRTLAGAQREINERVGKIEIRVDSLGTALIEIAKQEVRLADHERRLGKLEG